MISLRRFSHRSTRRTAKSSRRLRVESLEQRTMLTTFFVDGSAAGGGNGNPSSPFNTIQAAIDAAEASPGPDSVNISPGHYVENLVIEDSNKLTINGNGATVESALGDAEHTIEIDDSDNVVIRNLKVIGGDDGIRADDVGQLTLNRVQATGNDDEGVQANDTGSIRLIGVDLSNNDGDGLTVEEADTVQIVGGTFNTNDDGIDLEIVGSIRINNATADGNADEGLEVDDSGEITVIGGTFTNNIEAGLDIDDTVNIRVVGVVATGNGEHGLQVEAEDDGDSVTAIASVNIVNGVFSDNVGDGIQIVEEPGVTIDDVTIRNVHANNNTDHGLFINISGTLDKKNVKSNNNGLPDVP